MENSYLSVDVKMTVSTQFKNLDVRNPVASGNSFFTTEYWPGNDSKIKNQPFESFVKYENLLDLIFDVDPIKYKRIHKGTPYYFLSWLAFDIGNYEKAVFYMDAALVEDMKNDREGSKKTPAYGFMSLGDNEHFAANRTTKILKDRILTEINRFNGLSGLTEITLDDFVNKFVELFLNMNGGEHSIITALYSYILEYEDRTKELKLRSDKGGSIEPVLAYIFKGGLIFESLLKYFYPNSLERRTGIVESNDNLFVWAKSLFKKKCIQVRNKTINSVIRSPDFRKDFKLTITTSANKLKSILCQIGDKHDNRTAFNTTIQLRNTTGHDLIWDNVFDDPENFNKFYEQQMNAIFYLFAKKLFA